MDAQQTADRIAELYVSVYRHTYRRCDPRAPRPSGETLAFLQHLVDSGPLTVSEAARHFDRSQAAISERIERMLEGGLLERIQDDRDRRRHLVWLSEAGERLLREEREVLSRELLVGAAERMTVKDRQALVQGMAALLEAARAGARPNRGRR